ncbi:MAG: hypothetical protein ACLPOO_14105 [Terriglobales bacterium]
MGSFRLSCSPSVLLDDGPRIPIEISASEGDIKAGSNVGLEYPSPLRIEALIDTGANFTMVTQEVAEKCKLRATGFAPTIASLGKVGQYHEHAAWIKFPGTGLKDFRETRVVACDILQVSKRPYRCLIGRDILRNWLLTYSGDGAVTIQGLR